MTPRLSYNCILNMLKDMKMQKQYLTKDYQSTMNLIEMKYDKEPVFIFSVFQNISG